jgi:hypothetical protein
MNFFLSNNLFILLLTFILFFTLLILHLFYGCCTITFTATDPKDISIKEAKNSHQAYHVYQANQAKQANKYCPENHFFIPDQSLSREEIKFIAQRGGNNL